MYLYSEEEFKTYEANYQANDSHTLIAIYDDYPNEFFLFWENIDISDENITEKYYISPQKYTLNSFLPVDRKLWQFRSRFSSYYILLEDYIRKSLKEKEEINKGMKNMEIIKKIDNMSSSEQKSYFNQFPMHRELWENYYDSLDELYD